LKLRIRQGSDENLVEKEDNNSDEVLFLEKKYKKNENIYEKDF
tara:strand:+ start:1931 stop:2059 length:129 start_codon:yes stop_codon:yes gene_type:complete